MRGIEEVKADELWIEWRTSKSRDPIDKTEKRCFDILVRPPHLSTHGYLILTSVASTTSNSINVSTVFSTSPFPSTISSPPQVTDFDYQSGSRPHVSISLKKSNSLRPKNPRRRRPPLQPRINPPKPPRRKPSPPQPAPTTRRQAGYEQTPAPDHQPRTC
jgi:hypothetical protein